MVYPKCIMAEQENFAETLHVSTTALAAAALAVREQMEGLDPDTKAVNANMIALARKVTGLTVDLQGLVERWAGVPEGEIGPNVRAVFASYSPATRSIAEELYTNRGTEYAPRDLHHLVGGMGKHAKTNGVKRGRDRIDTDFPGRIQVRDEREATRIWWTTDISPVEDEERAREVLAGIAASTQESSPRPAGEGGMLEQTPAGFPEEVWARFGRVPQLMLKDLIAQGGEAIRPHDFSKFFDRPHGHSTQASISAYLRQLSEDPDVGQWLHRRGNGWSRFCLWGTADQADAIYEARKQQTAEKERLLLLNLRENYPSSHHPSRRSRETAPPTPRPVRKPKVSTSTNGPATSEPFFDYRPELEVSTITRDTERGAKVLRDWGLHIVSQQLEIRQDREHTEPAVLPEVDDLAVEIVQAAAEADTSLTPSDARIMLSEVRQEKIGIGAVLSRLDLLQHVFDRLQIPGWKDSGQVNGNGASQRRFRFFAPDELEPAEDND
jgi:hypothetical protein